MAGTGGAGRRRAVVMTDDEELLDEVVRLAAAAGAELERVPDAAGVRRRWHTAGLVLVDEDAARALGPLRLGRRDGVVLLCRASRRDRSGSAPWRWARSTWCRCRTASTG